MHAINLNADQAVTLAPNLRARVTRTPDAIVIRPSRRSPASLDDQDWHDELRGLVVPLEHVGEFLAVCESVARAG